MSIFLNFLAVENEPKKQTDNNEIIVSIDFCENIYTFLKISAFNIYSEVFRMSLGV